MIHSQRNCLGKSTSWTPADERLLNPTRHYFSTGSITFARHESLDPSLVAAHPVCTPVRLYTVPLPWPMCDLIAFLIAAFLTLSLPQHPLCPPITPSTYVPPLLFTHPPFFPPYPSTLTSHWRSFPCVPLSPQSTILYRITMGSVVATAPTVGSNHEIYDYKGVRFGLIDIGGQTSLRSSWGQYFAGTTAIILVIDSSDAGRLPLAKAELQKLVADEVSWA
jgi:hypothetical protein